MRSLFAGVLLVFSVLLTIPAVVTGWARAEVVDTDRFVATLGPLADEPAVQQMLTDQVMSAIEQNVDLSGLGSALDPWNLPPSAAELLEDLVGSAVEQARVLIETSVQRVVSSTAFSAVWATLLEQAHTRAIAVLENDPSSDVTIDQHGTVWLDLSPVIEQVKVDLAERGIPFASAIPQIDSSVPLLSSESVTSARFWYSLSTTLGAWLPWIVLALLVAGVALARRRIPALSWTALGYAGMLGVLLVILWFARREFIDQVAAQMSAEAGGAIFDQVTTNLRPTTALLLGAAVGVAAGSWLIGVLFRDRRRRA